jgi:hypothetical protein
MIKNPILLFKITISKSLSKILMNLVKKPKITFSKATPTEFFSNPDLLTHPVPGNSSNLSLPNSKKSPPHFKQISLKKSPLSKDFLITLFNSSSNFNSTKDPPTLSKNSLKKFYPLSICKFFFFLEIN